MGILPVAKSTPASLRLYYLNIIKSNKLDNNYMIR